ncbi:MAG TPA: hypothetical protein VG142_03470 [Trebonia sp.]|nr:hypothetical protein [Trebonia sp.]
MRQLSPRSTSAKKLNITLNQTRRAAVSAPTNAGTVTAIGDASPSPVAAAGSSSSGQGGFSSALAAWKQAQTDQQALNSFFGTSSNS